MEYIRSGNVFYVNVADGRRTVKARIVCDCGCVSRKFRRSSERQTSPTSLRPLVDVCPDCGETLSATAFFYKPYEFDTLEAMSKKSEQQGVPVVNAFKIRDFQVHYRIKCDRPGCTGYSQVNSIAGFGPGRFPLVGICQDLSCQKILESEINFGR